MSVEESVEGANGIRMREGSCWQVGAKLRPDQNQAIASLAGTISLLDLKFASERSFIESSGQSFLSDRYDTAIFCFSKGLPSSSTVPGVPSIPIIPTKEAKNRPTLSISRL